MGSVFIFPSFPRQLPGPTLEGVCIFISTFPKKAFVTKARWGLYLYVQVSQDNPRYHKSIEPGFTCPSFARQLLGLKLDRACIFSFKFRRQSLGPQVAGVWIYISKFPKRTPRRKQRSMGSQFACPSFLRQPLGPKLARGVVLGNLEV